MADIHTGRALWGNVSGVSHTPINQLQTILSILKPPTDVMFVSEEDKSCISITVAPLLTRVGLHC